MQARLAPLDSPSAVPQTPQVPGLRDPPRAARLPGPTIPQVGVIQHPRLWHEGDRVWSAGTPSDYVFNWGYADAGMDLQYGFMNLAEVRRIDEYPLRASDTLFAFLLRPRRRAMGCTTARASRSSTTRPN